MPDFIERDTSGGLRHVANPTAPPAPGVERIPLPDSVPEASTENVSLVIADLQSALADPQHPFAANAVWRSATEQNIRLIRARAGLAEEPPPTPLSMAQAQHDQAFNQRPPQNLLEMIDARLDAIADRPMDALIRECKQKLGTEYDELVASARRFVARFEGAEWSRAMEADEFTLRTFANYECFYHTGDKLRPR